MTEYISIWGWIACIRCKAPTQEVRTMTVQNEYMYRATPNIHKQHLLKKVFFFFFYSCRIFIHIALFHVWLLAAILSLYRQSKQCFTLQSFWPRSGLFWLWRIPGCRNPHSHSREVQCIADKQLLSDLNCAELYAKPRIKKRKCD